MSSAPTAGAAYFNWQRNPRSAQFPPSDRRPVELHAASLSNREINQVMRPCITSIYRLRVPIGLVNIRASSCTALPLRLPLVPSDNLIVFYYQRPRSPHSGANVRKSSGCADKNGTIPSFNLSPAADIVCLSVCVFVRVYVCVRLFVCVCVRACVHACISAYYARACVRSYNFSADLIILVFQRSRRLLGAILHYY